MIDISNRAKTDNIESNVRRTDDLLARFSNKYRGSKESMSSLDNLRASLDSMNMHSTTSPIKIKSGLYRLSSSHSTGTCRTSQSPLSKSYENEKYQLQLPIDNYFFQKLEQSLDEQDQKLSNWSKDLSNNQNLRKSFDSKIGLNEIQRESNELIDIQISNLESLSQDTAPSAFNDSKTIHKISKLLNERQSNLQTDKTSLQTQLERQTVQREQYEKQLQELTEKLHQTRNEESTINNKLHGINVELGSINDQVAMANTMKNKINQNLHTLNDVEKQLIDGINNLKKEMKAQWREFESQWQNWTLEDIATWIVHHGLQQKYEKKTLIDNLSNKLQIESGKELLNFSKDDWIVAGITNARDRQYLRNEFGILTAPNSVEEGFKCPLTKQIMKDPVIAADGYTYDRNSINEWFKNNRKSWNNIDCVISPITGDILTTDMTFSNHTLFKQIQDFRKANKAK